MYGDISPPPHDTIKLFHEKLECFEKLLIILRVTHIFELIRVGIKLCEWWREYLKNSQTGKPVNDNPSTTTATTNIEPNVKVTAWNSIDVDEGRIEIGKDGSIMWKGPTPEIHYPSNIDLNITPCNECMTDWLEAFNEQFK